ncbi:hypothetical protein K439DRAFT_1612945 [Ramaria rubella]|nr:hypothetical protein K439DRAFT_1612945 [Ramaria rubella]
MATRAPSPWACVFLEWLGGCMEWFSTKVVVTLPHPMLGALGEVWKSWLEATRDQRSRYVLLCMAADTPSPHPCPTSTRWLSVHDLPPLRFLHPQVMRRVCDLHTMTACLTQLTTLHIDQSPGITLAAFTALMQSPRLHTVFLVEVDGYRLLVDTGMSKSIRKLFLLDCKHIALVLGHCPRLLTLEVHERPILHNRRGGGRVHPPGGLCGLPDIGPLLPRSLQHLTLNAQGWPEDVYLRWHENPTMCGTRGGGGTAQPEALGLGEQTTSRGQGLRDIGSRRGGVVSLVFLGQRKNPAAVQSVSIVCRHDRLYGSLLAVLGGHGAHGCPPATIQAAPGIACGNVHPVMVLLAVPGIVHG